MMGRAQAAAGGSASNGAKSSRFAAGRRAEREAVLAYLRARRDYFNDLVRRSAGMDDLSADRARQLDVTIDAIAQDLHHG